MARRHRKVTPDIYTLTRDGSGEDLDTTGDLDLRPSLVLSATDAAPTIVTGKLGWSNRIFQVITGTATISGLTICRGSIPTSVSDGGEIKMIHR